MMNNYTKLRRAELIQLLLQKDVELAELKERLCGVEDMLNYDEGYEADV